MQVSVIIPTLNAEATIEPLLSALEKQSLPPEEIIVVDSSSTDQNNRVLLQIVSLARNVACYFDPVGKTYSGDLTKS